MNILCLTFLLLSAPVFAQKSLSQPTFQASIRPVLNGIINDFYQMVAHFPNFPREIVGLVEQMEKFSEARISLRTTCPRLLNYKCQQPLDEIRMKLTAVEARTLELVARWQPEDAPYMNTAIALRLVTEFQDELRDFKESLDHTSFLMRARVPHRYETDNVIKKLDELQTMLSVSVVEYVPYLYKEDFRHFYFQFIHPLEVQMVKSQNYEYFNRNITSLNFALNLLNMNLTKRNKKTPEGMAPYLSLMHNRWNSILRYYY